MHRWLFAVLVLMGIAAAASAAVYCVPFDPINASFHWDIQDNSASGFIITCTDINNTEVRYDTQSPVTRVSLGSVFTTEQVSTGPYDCAVRAYQENAFSQASNEIRLDFYE